MGSQGEKTLSLFVNSIFVSMFIIEPRSSAVAEKPRDASRHRIFR